MNFSGMKLEAKNKLLNELLADPEIIGQDDKIEKFELKPVKEYSSEAMEQINNPNKIVGIDTGYDNLNSIIRGFSEEDLIVIGGGTGHGKSQFVQSLIINITSIGIPVLFITLEMSAVEITIRFISMLKTKDHTQIIGNLPIYFYSGDGISLKLLDSVIKDAVERLGVKMVFIDHLHFFARHVDNQSAEIGNITRTIKLMARKYQIPIGLVSHIRKINNTTEIPNLDDLRDSSFISQDADMVLMVWRDINSEAPIEFNTLKVQVRKNRRFGTLSGCQFLKDENGYLQEVKYTNMGGLY